jgi:DNA-binding transcriptional ArsR family regulator
VSDDLCDRYRDLLDGHYDCVDRIVLNAYFALGHGAGGFRVWWRRWHNDSDAELDNAHLMRLAGRFSRRVRAWAKANDVPVIDCKAGERKHLIAEEYLAEHAVGPGVFMVLVAKAPATLYEVTRSSHGVLVNLEKKRSYVNHYSFHIIDPVFGHVTIKMSGHPPFPAQVILNGHEYVACEASAAGIAYRKEGNCFTGVPDPAGLARVADTLSSPEAIGRLGQVCDRWIYSACLCFGLDLDEQSASGFRYDYSVYQLEYSRNLLFGSGRKMEEVFERIVDRSRTRLDIKTLRTLFGYGQRPRRRSDGDLSPRQAVVIETPSYDLTVFKVHFGLVTLKAYSKGEHVLRFEAVVHNTRQLHLGRVLERFPEIVARLHAMLDRFTSVLDCVDVAFLPGEILDELPRSSRLGATRVGGIDLNKARVRAVLAAVVALAAAPRGFTVADLTEKVHSMTGETDYRVRQAAYDLRKLRAKGLVEKPERSRRYVVPPDAARTITALSVLRDQVVSPILAGVRSPRQGRKPSAWTRVDRDYESLRIGMQTLFDDLGISTTALAA